MTAPAVDRPVAPSPEEARPPCLPAASSRLADFHPAWSSTVMGTGIVGIIAAANPGRIAGLAPTMTLVGQVFAVLAFGLAIALGVPYVVRWIRYPAAARRDLANPALGAMHATFPAGILVLGATIAAVGPTFLDQGVVTALVAVAAITGGILGLVFGVGGVALIRLAGAGPVIWGTAAPAVGAMSALAALAIWGLGLWWLPLAALLLRRYAQAGLPFGLGWWAFTFPVGAYAMSTLTLGRALDLPLFETLGVALFAILVVFWVVVATRTVGGVRSGVLWRREAPRAPA